MKEHTAMHQAVTLKNGMGGFIVDAYPDTYCYTVELIEDGETIGIVLVPESEIAKAAE